MAHTHSKSHSHYQANARLNVRAIVLSVSLSVVLVALKGYAWVVTDSLSVFTSLLDSSFDVFISMLNMLAVYYAAKPADDNHSFGHTAIEDIVGLIQATFIGASGLFVIYEAIHRFITPQPLLNSGTGIVIIGVSVLFALVIVVVQTLVARKTNSIVLKAELLHYMSDFLLNGAIILSLYLTAAGYGIADPLIGLAIALYILRGAWQIGVHAFHNLMDRELEADLRNQLQDIVKNYKGIRGVHDFKTRRSGSRVFVQCHIEIDKTLTVAQAHKITDGLEDKLLKALPEAEVILHQDPV